MQRIPMPYFVPFLVVLSLAASANAADRAVLEQKLTAKYRLSTVNAEGEFVTKGTTLVLRKGGFTGGADPLTCIHQYNDGKISLTGPSKAACTGAMRILSKIPGIKLIPGVGTANSTAQGAAPATRPFVAGEKLYMTKIEVVKDDIDLTLTSDQVDQVRYRAEIRFHKAAKLEVLEAESLIAEVLGIGAGGGGGKPATSTQSTATQPAAAPAAAPVETAPAPAVAAPVQTAPVDNTPPAPIAPPPPPPDQPVAAPPTITPGMTIDQVVAVLGQPTKIVDLGAKKIYAYPNQKLTFVDGKFNPAAETDDSSASPTGSSSNLLPYGLGLAVLVLGGGAFLFMRGRKPAAVAVPAGPPVAMPPAYQPPPPVAAAAAASPMAAAPPVAAAGTVNLIERLEELEKLRDRGILTQQEFDREKAKLRSL